MTSASPPIPSKGALRALRRLALGTPGFLVGAVGSICGLAAVNHEARRRVRMAERILETKRTISSVSNGRSSSRVRRMFEAAEKGEDFLLDPSKLHERRGRRNNNTTTTTPSKQLDEAVSLLQAARGRIISRRPHGAENVNADGRAGPGQTNVRLRKMDRGSETSGVVIRRLLGRDMDVHRKEDEALISRIKADTRDDLARRVTTQQTHTGSDPSLAKSPQTGTRHDFSQDIDVHEKPAELNHRSFLTPKLTSLRHHLKARSEIGTEQEGNLLAVPVNVGRTGEQHKVSNKTDLWEPTSSGTTRALAASNDGSVAHSYQRPMVSDVLHAREESPRIDQDELRVAFARRRAKTEHLRIATMTPMKRSDYPAHARRGPSQQLRPLSTTACSASPTNGYWWETSANPTIEQNTKTPVFETSTSVVAPGMAFDLALRADEDSAPDFQGRPNAASRESSDQADVSSDQSDVEFLDETFREWPGMPQSSNHDDIPGLLRYENGDGQQPGDIAALFESAYNSVQDELDGNSPASDTVDPSPISDERIRDDEAWVQETLSDLLSESVGTQADFFHTQVLSVIGHDLYAEICQGVRGKGARTNFVCKLQLLLQKGTALDLVLAELLFHTFFKPLRMQTIPIAAIELAQSLISSNASHRAALILYPYSVEEAESFKLMKRVKIPIQYQSASRYLERQCYASQDLSVLCEQTRQVIELGVSRGIPPDQNTVLPVIRYLCGTGRAAQADHFLQELEKGFDLDSSKTLFVKSILLIGYATANDLAPVRLIFDELHASAVSRKKSLYFSRLFDRVLQLHLRHNPLTDSCEFVIHAMSYWGLIPHGRVSSTLISACLKEEKYDFIQEYVQAVRQIYPFVESGTTDSFAAWRFARVWQEMNATCEEIEKGCHAMAYSATSDPFSKSLRGVALEAVCLHISKCLSKLLAVTTSQDEEDISKELRVLPFHWLVERAKQALVAPSLLPPTKQYYNARDDLLRQIKSVTRLNHIFAGDKMDREIDLTPSQKSTFHQVDAYEPADDLAAEIFQAPDKIPAKEDLWRLMATHYARRQKQGDAPDHALLRHTVAQLRILQRAIEAADLLRVVYESPYVKSVNGTGFDENLFTLWLEVAAELASPRETSDAMWAFLDSGRHLVTSTHFLLRCRLSIVRAAGGEEIATREEHEELDYLFERIHSRHRRTAESWGEERIQFAEYSDWEEGTTEMDPMPAEQSSPRIMGGGKIEYLSQGQPVGRAVESVAAM